MGAGAVQGSLLKPSSPPLRCPFCAVLQIETDKVTVDVRAPKAGVVEAILVSTHHAVLCCATHTACRIAPAAAQPGTGACVLRTVSLFCGDVAACLLLQGMPITCLEPPPSADAPPLPTCYPAHRSSQTTMWRLGMWWLALVRWAPPRLPLHRSPRPRSSRQQHPRHRRRLRRRRRRLGRRRPHRQQRQLLPPWHIASQAFASRHGAHLMASRSQRCPARKRSE